MRTVIHEAVADIDSDAAEIVLTLHWMGGAHTEHRLPKRRRRQRNATPDTVVDAVRTLALIAKDDVIAGLLTRTGLKTGNGNLMDPRAGHRAAVELSHSRSPSCRGRPRPMP